MQYEHEGRARLLTNTPNNNHTIIESFYHLYVYKMCYMQELSSSFVVV